MSASELVWPSRGRWLFARGLAARIPLRRAGLAVTWGHGGSEHFADQKICANRENAYERQ